MSRVREHIQVTHPSLQVAHKNGIPLIVDNTFGIGGEHATRSDTALLLITTTQGTSSGPSSTVQTLSPTARRSGSGATAPSSAASS